MQWLSPAAFNRSLHYRFHHKLGQWRSASDLVSLIRSDRYPYLILFILSKTGNAESHGAENDLAISTLVSSSAAHCT